MSDDPRIGQLLEEALDSDRTPEEVCAHCPELLGEVRERWRRVRSVKAHLDTFFPESGSKADDGSRLVRPADPPVIPGYTVESVLGRGGMGVVYKARHLKLRRTVALKMLLAGAYAGAQEVARFTREAQAVASLRHENVVQVYDVGELEGRPYFTMEFLEGGTLAEQLAGAPQPAREAAARVATLAGAVSAAHRGGIVHRDLKPGNVLLTADGTPKISDFGVAARFEGEASLTLSGGRVGTPSYMAPEQAVGKTGEVGPAADIYSLGAILYEMLTGRPPFRGATPTETLWQSAHHEPVAPARLVPRVPRDLETICLKCLEKDPARRYATAGDLADDLGRFLRNEPIRARPVGRAERLRRWVSRHKGVSAALAAVALLLIVLSAGSMLAAAHFRSMEQVQRVLAREKGQLADEKGRLAGEKELEREKAVGAERREAGLRGRAERQGEEMRRNLYDAQMNLGGQAALSPSGVGRVMERLAPWEFAEPGRPDLRGWEWYYLDGLCHRGLLTLRGHLHGVTQVAWSPDGRRLASAGSDNTVRLWDPVDGRELCRPLLGHGREVISVAWSPDGRRLASASWDGKVILWGPDNGAKQLTFGGHAGEVFSVAWSPDGTRLASCGADQTVQIWSADTGTVLHVLRGHAQAVQDVAWRRDGKCLASAGRDYTVRVWDPVAGTEVFTLRGHTNWVNRVAWSRDGARLASASNDQTAKVWDPVAGRDLLTLRGHTQGVQSVSWSPDGTRLATGGDDQTVRLWPAIGTAGGPETLTLRGHTKPVTSVAWSPDGTRLVSSSFDGSLKVWDPAAPPEPRPLRGHAPGVNSVAWSRDGRRLASAGMDGTVKVWDPARVGVPRTFRGYTSRVNAVAWSPDGTRLAFAGADGAVRVQDADRGTEPASLRGHAGEVFALAWAPDGRRLASAGIDKTLRVWDPAAAREISACRGHLERVYSVAWNPDGSRLASASGDGTVRLWDPATGALTLSLGGHSAEVKSVAWSPDGTRLASASNDQTVLVHEAATGRLTLALRGHTTRVNAVAWSPDGARLATAGGDPAVKIWDAETGKELLTLPGGVGEPGSLAWGPDGLALACAGTDPTILIHDATAGYVARRSPRCLPAIDRRLRSDPSDAPGWRLRAEVHARGGDWDSAGSDLGRYLALNPRLRWDTLGCWAVGPYPEDLKESYPPETNLDPARPVPVTAGAAGAAATASTDGTHWQPVPLNADGFVNFGPLFGNAEHISAYALFRVYCPGERNVALLLGSDDQARVWLNGRQVYECLQTRAARADEDAVWVPLRAGWNTLLARVANVTGAHALYLRLSDAPADLARAGGEAAR